MSALRLINETELSSATIFDITNVFTTDFDIYQVTLNNMNTSADAGVYLQFLNTSGSLVATNIDYATLEMYSNAVFGETRATNTTIIKFATCGGATAESMSAEFWIFNPMNSSSYTFGLSQSNAFENVMESHKTIFVQKQTQQIAGLRFIAQSSATMSNAIARVYGLRVDNG